MERQLLEGFKKSMSMSVCSVKQFKRDLIGDDHVTKWQISMGLVIVDIPSCERLYNDYLICYFLNRRRQTFFYNKL